MKKMNNTKTTKVTKKARIGIAALAAIMTMSFAAPLAVNSRIDMSEFMHNVFL